jgi:hypothetical protein
VASAHGFFRGGKPWSKRRTNCSVTAIRKVVDAQKTNETSSLELRIKRS